MLEHLWLSLGVSAAAIVLSLPFGIACAWFFARSRVPGLGILQTIVMLPLVLPPAVTGIILLWIFSPERWLGKTLEAVGVPVAFHWLGAVVAAAVVGFPLLVMNVTLAIKAVDPRMETISQSLGDSPWRSFLRVTLPLAYPGILAGIVLAFARGLGEFGATIVLATNIPGETDTISLAIYAYLKQPGNEQVIWGLSLLSLGLGFTAIAASRALEHVYSRRLELP